MKFNLLVGLGSSNESFLFQKMLKFNCGYRNTIFGRKSKIKKIDFSKNFTNQKSVKIIKNFKKITNIKQINKIDKNIFTHQYPRKQIST